MELWMLNQLCGTEFGSLANAIKHADQEELINEAERRRLWVVNDARNDAKHRGLGTRAGSRRLTPAPRARTCSPRAGSRAVSSMDPAPLPPHAAPISAPLPPPWGASERRQRPRRFSLFRSSGRAASHFFPPRLVGCETLTVRSRPE